MIKQIICQTCKSSSLFVGEKEDEPKYEEEMKITITEKGIKPEDVFKIIEPNFKYLCCDIYLYLENQRIDWYAYEDIPSYDKDRKEWVNNKNGRDYLYLKPFKIDYTGKPEDSLFCREDL